MVIMIVAKFHQSKKEIQDDLKSLRSQFVSKRANQIKNLWIDFEVDSFTVFMLLQGLIILGGTGFVIYMAIKILS